LKKNKYWEIAQLKEIGRTKKMFISVLSLFIFSTKTKTTILRKIKTARCRCKKLSIYEQKTKIFFAIKLTHAFAAFTWHSR
jgi:hypothetical protein